jgi:hypothetical protein
MKFGNIIFIALMIVATQLFAQGELDSETKKLVFKNEKTYAIYLNSNGYGVNYRYGKRLDGYRKRTYDFDLNYVKHPKEVRTQNPYYNNPNRYVFGKTNVFFHVKATIGHQREIFSKFDRGGLAIIHFYSLGVSVGFLKPVYYVVEYPTSDPYNPNMVTEKFNPNIHRIGDIYGRAPFTIGINETKVVPGISFRYGFSFDYAASDTKIRAIETGFCIDAYLQKMQIMATEDNSQIFFSVFVAYRIGKALSSRHKNSN